LELSLNTYTRRSPDYANWICLVSRF
jgi:hypothetical protein